MKTKLLIVVLLMTSLNMIPTYGQDPPETEKPALKNLDEFFEWIIDDKTKEAAEEVEKEKKAQKKAADEKNKKSPEASPEGNEPKKDKNTEYRDALAEINAQTKVQQKYLSSKENPFGKNFMVTTGAILLNPYTICQNEDGTYELKGESETETEFFIEMIARSRPAWEKKARQDKLDNPWYYFVPTDLEGRMGFVTDTSKVSGSTVAGSGEGFIEASIGWQLYSHTITTSFNVETLFCMVTDREFQDIHDSYHAGFCYIAGIPVPNDTDKEDSQNTTKPSSNATTDKAIDTRRVIELALGAYYCGVETPRFADEETNLLVTHRGEPDFFTDKGVMIRGDINIPFNKTGSLCLVSRYYLGTNDINPWSLRLGMTINVQALLGLFSFNSTD